MLYLIILLVILSALVFLATKTDNDIVELIAGVLAMLSGIFLFFLLVAIPIGQITARGEIAEYHALVITVENARENKSQENAALTLKIIEVNQWLASAKYYHKHFPLWIPKEVMDLEPIR